MTAKEQLDRWAKQCEQVSPMRVVKLSRDGLIKKFAEFEFKIGAEIGVDSGRFSEIMCKSIPGLKLICVDPWMTKEADRSGYHGKYEQAKKRLAPYNCEIFREISMEAVSHYEDGELDFVYIDGNHTFDYAMQDIIEWSKKVKPGGIVAGHDYYRFRNAGVVGAVDAYTKAHGISQWFLTDHLKSRDRTPSFFWLKR